MASVIYADGSTVVKLKYSELPIYFLIIVVSLFSEPLVNIRIPDVFTMFEAYKVCGKEICSFFLQDKRMQGNTTRKRTGSK